MRTGSTESEAEAELSANQKTLYKSLSILEQEKNDGSRGKLAEAVRHFPVFYWKSCRDFQDVEQEKIGLAWEDVAKQVGLQTVMYCSVDTIV